VIDLDQAAEQLVRESTSAQELPYYIEDELFLARISRLIVERRSAVV
jgi:hypothetical protein